MAVSTLDKPKLALVRMRYSDRLAMWIYIAASFAGSALLFMIQPIVGRILLPQAGGTASLWNTAMVFFQVVLLLGYIAAHYGAVRIPVAKHRFVHVGALLMAFVALPLAVPSGWQLSAESQPVWSTLGVLVRMVGLPFLVLATSSPILQRWFATTHHPRADSPYFLYAAGNVGSVLGLLGYPFVVERFLGLNDQRKFFAWGWAAFVVLTAMCALLTGDRRPSESRLGVTSDITHIHRLRWMLWSAVPSALLLGTTRYITTDLASFPLLWVLPLSLYLVSFIVAFGRKDPGPISRTAGRATILTALPLIVTFLSGIQAVWILVAHMAWLFLAALAAHSRLATDRPPAHNLTEFYVWVSLGGALGGAVTTLLAPMVLNQVWEYPLAIGLAVAIASGRNTKRGSALTWVVLAGLIIGGIVVGQISGPRYGLVLLAVAGLVAFDLTAASFGLVLAVLAVSSSAIISPPALHRERSFFGVYEVSEDNEGNHSLRSGTTVHGVQIAGRPASPTSYYDINGPLGTILGRNPEPEAVAVVGLGAGEIAGYGQRGDSVVFYEIDPAIADIATNTDLFTHLDESQADIDIVIGDGRLQMEADSRNFDYVVVDAFNSDAIPIHLVTQEAFSVYLDHANDTGAVLVHVSNRHLQLDSVVARIGAELGVSVRSYAYHPTEDELQQGATDSHWMLLSRSNAFIESLGEEWVTPQTVGPLWTDDYSNVLAVLIL